MTVSKLAQTCGLSRTAVLYYESIGLLRARRRSDGNYRTYGDEELTRLRQICAYRNAGVKLADIRSILDQREGDAPSILKRRLLELDSEIERLREHQRSLLRLLGSAEAWKGSNEMMTKEKWVGIMRATGFTEDDMRRWHKEFEESAPEDHQEFLKYLQIPADEIRSIREWSSKA